jgi:hypothetical protein
MYRLTLSEPNREYAVDVPDCSRYTAAQVRAVLHQVMKFLAKNGRVTVHQLLSDTCLGLPRNELPIYYTTWDYQRDGGDQAVNKTAQTLNKEERPR